MGPGKSLPANGTIELRFDHLLLPISVARQSAIIRQANGEIAAAPVVQYDPAGKTVTLSASDGRPWLESGQYYVLDFITYRPDAGPGGFRTLLGATMDPHAASKLGFFATDSVTINAPHISFCRDIEPILTTKCGRCHGGQSPAMALQLDSTNGIRATAIRQLARGSNAGASSTPRAASFGTDMAIIEPHAPGSSWLMYKVLLASPSSELTVPTSATCGGDVFDALVLYANGIPTPLDDRERTVLGMFVEGAPMPYPVAQIVDATHEAPLTQDELLRMSEWIRDGASLE